MRAAALALTLTLVSSTSVARAAPDDLDRAYVYDGAMVPLLYLPLTANLTLRRFGNVRTEPLWFSDDASLGRPAQKSQVPHWASFAAAGTVGAYMLWADDSRYFHLKGLAQTLVLTTTATQIFKYTFGRRRPSYKIGQDNPVNARKSFVSGHASLSAADASYAGLYLRYQGFDRFRDGVTWWEVTTFDGLAGLALYVPYTRVRDHHHHLADVIAGSMLGAGIAAAVFFYQQGRYDDAARESRAAPIVVTLPF